MSHTGNSFESFLKDEGIFEAVDSTAIQRVQSFVQSGSMKAILTGIPPGLLDDLPVEDQNAIRAIVGKPVKLNGYDDRGYAELEFDGHTIWVDPSFIQKI